MTLPSAPVKGATRTSDVDASGFRKVNAHPRTDIRLESSKRESRDEVPHKRTSVNEGSPAVVSHHDTIDCQGRVSAASKAVVKEVSFNRRTKYACAKDVTTLDAAKKTNVVFRVDNETVSELIRKSFGPATVLIDIGSHVDRAVETESVKWRWNRGDLLGGDHGLPGLQWDGDKRQQD